MQVCPDVLTSRSRFASYASLRVRRVETSVSPEEVAADCFAALRAVYVLKAV